MAVSQMSFVHILLGFQKIKLLVLSSFQLEDLLSDQADRRGLRFKFLLTSHVPSSLEGTAAACLTTEFNHAVIQLL